MDRWDTLGTGSGKETGCYRPLGVMQETVDAFNEPLIGPFRDRSVAELHAVPADLAAYSREDHSGNVFDITEDHDVKHLDDLPPRLTMPVGRGQLSVDVRPLSGSAGG